ncbi:MAG: EF-hand domain-containing protein [Candidatus Thalassarchaeaceae archaeon]|nr:EF-hand domain-containing protein [Candidatus Thalassarchaeaceae archaeon]
MSRTLVLITSLIMITTSASGCLSGDTVEDILGCMDENAANYDENATLEALGDCFFIATMETFIHTMDNQMTINEMLDLNTRAGYSTVMYTNSSGGEGEMIALEGLHIEEHVMVDLANNSAMVRTVLSMGPMISIDNQVIQVGQVVNVHNSVSGMMAADAGGAQTYSAQTRDVEGTVMDLVESMVADSFMSLMTMDDMMDDEDTESDVMDDMPEDLEASFSYDSSENSQSMVATYTEEGASTEMAIVLDDSSNLMSYTMTSVDGTNDSTIIHTVMWGDAVVIEVDDTLPKSATPVIFEGLNDFDPFEEEDDEEEGEGDDGPTAEEFLYMTDQNGDDQVSWSEIEDFFTAEEDWESDGLRAYFQSHFDTSDENGDGYLTDDEILLFNSIFDEDEDGDDPSPEEVLQWFDMDGDDHLSWDEFWNSYSEGDESDEEISDLQEIFDASDDDGNSLLGIDELQYFIDMLIEYEDENDDGSSGPGDGTGSGCGDGSGDGDPNTPCDDDDDGSGGGSGDGSGDGSDDDGPPSPEEAMDDVDTNDDGYMSYQEFEDSWESENPELDWDEVTTLFDDCDDDYNDLIDIDEMQCFVDGIVDMLPDGDDEDPEQMFGHIDTDDDGYVSLQDLIDFSNEGGDDSDDEIDEEELANWFSWCDTDEDDLLNLDEFTTCVEDDDDDEGDGDDYSADEAFEWMNTDGDGQITPSEWADFANLTGDIIEEEDFNNLVYMMDMYDYDDSDGLDIYEFTEMWDEINNDDGDDPFYCDNGNVIPMDYVDDGYDDCGDGSDESEDGGGDENEGGPVFGTIADGLTFAAPISDFEIRFLNCNEVDSLDDCSLVASGTLESGIASAPAEVGCTLGCDIPFTFEDVDMDGMMSSGDTLSVDDSMGFYVAIYDTWAGQYTDDSTAGPVSLPGFGGFLAMICLIGAGLISRRD